MDMSWASNILSGGYRFILPRDKNIFFLEYFAPCACYLIDFLCIIYYNDHFTRRKCISSGADTVKYQKKYSGVLDFFASKLRLKIYWKIFIHGCLMYRISDDHEMSMNKAEPVVSNQISRYFRNLTHFNLTYFHLTQFWYHYEVTKLVFKYMVSKKWFSEHQLYSCSPRRVRKLCTVYETVSFIQQ